MQKQRRDLHLIPCHRHDLSGWIGPLSLGMRPKLSWRYSNFKLKALVGMKCQGVQGSSASSSNPCKNARWSQMSWRRRRCFCALLSPWNASKMELDRPPPPPMKFGPFQRRRHKPLSWMTARSLGQVGGCSPPGNGALDVSSWAEQWPASIWQHNTYQWFLRISYFSLQTEVLGSNKNTTSTDEVSVTNGNHAGFIFLSLNSPQNSQELSMNSFIWNEHVVEERLMWCSLPKKQEKSSKVSKWVLTPIDPI